MPTAALKVQQNGTIQGYDSIVGASLAYQAVDDSDGTTHDGDASYVLLPRTGPIFDGLHGRISFPMFLWSRGMIPITITLNAGTRRNAGGNPEMEVGFYRNGVYAFDPTSWLPGSTYSVEQRSFQTNPLTGLAWTDDLGGIEVCIGNREGGAAGKNRVTLLSATVVYRQSIYAYGYQQQRLR